MGNGEAAASFQEVIGFAVFNGVLEDGAAAKAAALQDEYGAGGSGYQPRVVARAQPGGVDDAIGQAVEVDCHLGGIVGVAASAGRASFAPLTLPFLLVPGLLVRTFLLIASGQERGRLVGAEQREVEGARDRTVVRGHVQPAGVEPVVGGGQEVEVLAGLVPHRRDRVGHAVGELARLARFGVVDEDRAQLVVQAAGVGQPARVR